MTNIPMLPGTIATPPVDDNYITEIEERLHIKFPPDFTDFLKHNGGGQPTTNTFTTENHTWKINRFLCLLRDFDTHPLGWYDIETTWLLYDDRLTNDSNDPGAQIVPIALLTDDNLLCLDYRQTPATPTVTVWLNEESEELAPTTIPVADTFTDFLNLLA